jgi:cytoskeletal protein CcmA (bactofilin family)
MVFGGKDRRPKTQQPARPAAKAAVEIETILGPNTSLKGDVRSSGGVRVDGDFEGSIDIAGNLIVGEAAKVVATITAHNVQIQGTVQGDVTARRLEILDTGKLWGDIAVDSFVLDDGGFFRGQSKMQGDVEPPLLEPPKPTPAPRPKPTPVVEGEATVSRDQ